MTQPEKRSQLTLDFPKIVVRCLNRSMVLCTKEVEVFANMAYLIFYMTILGTLCSNNAVSLQLMRPPLLSSLTIRLYLLWGLSGISTDEPFATRIGQLNILPYILLQNIKVRILKERIFQHHMVEKSIGLYGFFQLSFKLDPLITLWKPKYEL